MQDESNTAGPAEADAASPLPVIRGYRVRRVINHGGMATVYLADQVAPPRPVAVKVLLAHTLADEVSRRRFENEVRTIARLDHPHIVQIYELGRTADDVPFYSMPYLSRGHLGQRRFVREDGGCDEARVLEVLRAVLSALGYAHSRGIVHRDVKAENVLFDESERPKLADFGIALRRGYGTRVTAVGLAVGTTAYMAPEQARGQEVDARADLYSVGVPAYEMLTGELPFRAADALSMAMLHTQAPVPKLPASLRHWQGFVNRAMAKSPRARHDSAADMLRDLDRIERAPRWPRMAPLGVSPALARLRGIVGGRPAMTAATVAVLAAVALAVSLLVGRDDGFYRASPAPGAGAPIASGAGDPSDAMFEPLPVPPAQPHVDAARTHIRARNLVTGAQGHAYASVLAAWQADPASPLVHEAVGELSGALAREVTTALRDGRDARAREYMGHAVRLAQDTGITDTPQQRSLRGDAAKALDARSARAARDFDREAARAVVALATQLELPAPDVARLRKRADAIPRAGQAIPGDPTGAVLGKGRIAIGGRPVTRADYARFVAATGRKASLCRERASLLRIVKPRAWDNPGFAQSSVDAVVCVSFADAQAYAGWLAARTGHRYRLPDAGDGVSGGGHARALWLRECAASCAQRRTTAGPRAAERGYEDVGFRLVREL